MVAAGPESAPWGERYVAVEAPYGYVWKFFRVLPDPPDDGRQAVVDMWFGTGPTH